MSMKHLIKSVTVTGLWDIKNVSIALNDDVNVLIGGNGAGKTTLLRVIEGLLNVDLQTIDDIVFNEVQMVLHANATEADITIKVEKVFEDPVSALYRYDFGDEIIDIRLSDIRMFYRSRTPSNTVFRHLKNKLDGLVNLTWLSVNRASDTAERRMNDELHDDVDVKLSQLMNQIVSYRLQLETKVNERTKKFNEDLVSLLLYNETYDTVPKFEDLVKLKTQSTDDIITQLHKVFSYFGDPRLHTEDIKRHAEKIQSMVENLTSGQEKRKNFQPEDLLALSLLNRTIAIFSLSSEYQKDRADIMEPIRTYVEIVAQYFKDKVLEFDASTGELTTILRYGKDRIRKLSIYSLSSGERQLLILLTETLLQQKKPFVFIADEPELSLHIEWQRNLINSIRELNPNAQVLFATHAPEIAANHANKLIYLSDHTSYAE